jgi:hypothetical protein
MRRAIASAALAGFLAFGGLFPIAVRAQVVIRERIEVGAEVRPPDSVAASAAAPFVPVDGPISGYQVYYTRVGPYGPRAVTEGYPQALEGTLSVVESASGLSYSASVSDGFENGPIAATAWCYTNGSSTIWWEDYQQTPFPGAVAYRQRSYTPLTEVELLRVPTRAGHTYDATLQIRNSTISANSSTFGTQFGCKPINQMTPFCSCYANTTQTFKHVTAYFRRVILPPPPPDHFTVAAAPDTVEAGATSAITVVARDSLGSEVTFTATTPVTLTLSDASWGQLAYGGTTGASVTAPYSAARGGSVSFVADTTTWCGFGAIEVGAAGGGIAGSGVVVVNGGSASAFGGCEPPDPCDDEIIPCSNTEIQTFDLGLSILGPFEEGEAVEYQLAAGVPFPVPIEQLEYATCEYPRLGPVEHRLGAANSLARVTRGQIRVEPCLDVDAGEWIFRASNVQVPVLAYYCHRDNYVTLSDATDAVFEQHITESNYRDIIRDLERFWIPGVYSARVSLETNYVWVPGIRAHEEAHAEQIMVEVERAYNEAFEQLRTLSDKATVAEYPCPEDAIEALRTYRRSLLFVPLPRGGFDHILDRAAARADLRRQENREQRADDAARGVYRDILRRLKEWVLEQHWN